MEQYQQSQNKKTWSAPNTDPFGTEQLEMELNKKVAKAKLQLEDPLQRKSSNPGHSQGGGYQPSFAGGGARVRGRYGGGSRNSAPPGMDHKTYLQELEEQMQEQM